MASISQFISITSLIQGGVTGATRVAFYGPVATGDMKKASVVYKTSQSFYTKFALALSGYVAVLAVVYPKFVETPFSYIDALLLVLVLGMNAIFESMFGIPSQLLMFADQKAYFNTFLQIFCTIGNAFVSVILIKIGCSLLVVKFAAALIFILRPIILNAFKVGRFLGWYYSELKRQKPKIEEEKKKIEKKRTPRTPRTPNPK